VVLSSRIIPGNEKTIYRMIDHLFRREAYVIYEDGTTPPIHVSGHASQEELKLISTWYGRSTSFQSMASTVS